MKNRKISAVLLLAGVAGGFVVMAFHPTGHSLMQASDPAAAVAANRALHGLALATLPLLFLGLLGFTRALGSSDLAVAGLVLHGFGSIGSMLAALMSGFVASDLILHATETGSDPAAVAIDGELLRFGFRINQASFSLAVVAISLAIVLWSLALLRGGGRLGTRAVAGVGLLVGLATVAVVLSGHLALDVHGLMVVTLAQSIWLVGVAVLLLRAEGGTAGS